MSKFAASGDGSSVARGFTLVELLVALFIAAITLTMGYGAINVALQNRAAIEEQQTRLLEVQTAMRVLTQDFTQLAPRPVRDPVGDNWQPALRGASNGQPIVTVTRSGWTNPAGIQRPALQRASYVLEGGILRREHWPVLDATLGNEPIRRELLTRVRSVSLRYMGNPGQWYEQWPAATVAANAPGLVPAQAERQRLRALPVAVEITLELEDWGRIVRIFEIAR